MYMILDDEEDGLFAFEARQQPDTSNQDVSEKEVGFFGSDSKRDMGREPVAKPDLLEACSENFQNSNG